MLLLPDNPAVTVELCYRSALLKALLNRVMTALAQRLKIVRVMEECFIAFMWRDVVNDGSGYHLVSFEMKLTERLLLQLVVAKPIPALRVIEVMPG